MKSRLIFVHGVQDRLKQRKHTIEGDYNKIFHWEHNLVMWQALQNYNLGATSSLSPYSTTTNSQRRSTNSWQGELWMAPKRLVIRQDRPLETQFRSLDLFQCLCAGVLLLIIPTSNITTLTCRRRCFNYRRCKPEAWQRNTKETYRIIGRIGSPETERSR